MGKRRMAGGGSTPTWSSTEAPGAVNLGPGKVEPRFLGPGRVEPRFLGSTLARTQIPGSEQLI